MTNATPSSSPAHHIIPFNPIFVFLLILTFLPLAHSQCTRTSPNNASPPSFLCQLNVTFTRQSDCSAIVSETLVFPHTTDLPEIRVIQAIPSVQLVTNIKLQRNPQPLEQTRKLDATQNPDGTVTVVLPTQRSTTPVTFLLSYSISNAVMRFTDGCGKGKPNPDNNVMRWRTGPLDKTVDRLSVQFSTTQKASLSAVGGETQSKIVSFNERNFENDPDFSVQEAGARLCQVDEVCFTRPLPIWRIAVILAMIGVPVVLAATCLFVFVICEICGVRSEVDGDEPIDEHEVVGFMSGRHATCIPNHHGDGGCECDKETELFV